MRPARTPQGTVLVCLAVTLAMALPAAAKPTPGAVPAKGKDGGQHPEALFRREMVPVLTKVGCNSGACHGSFQGRGGFRLSLLGFDPVADYDALVHEALGRRVSPAVPDQ